MMHITEDTPPDMLAGAMDLAVSLPDGRDVKMAVERSTPMMDLLVQVTTAYKLRPSEHIVQALDTSSLAHERVLPYKPNTPIGALDTQHIRVLGKGRAVPAPKGPAPGQPFESTFRLQVHLPRNQFCVIRVGKHCLLEEIMARVCREKNLDPRKYEFRHPANIDKVLDPKRTLSDYEITEITVVPRGSGRLPQTLSSSDIMALQREEERRKMQAKTGGGVLNLIFRRGRNSMGSGSISSDTRSISPTQSDDSRSVTPPAVQPPQMLPSVPQEQPSRPKPPQRKRRPAPKPPSNNQDTEHHQPENRQETLQPETTKQHLENGLTICHSRNSSDSSGYHEASILSDNCNTTLPRRPKSTLINSSGDSALGMDKSADYSKSTSNLSNMVSHSKSTTSLTNAGRKKKAPPPPVIKSAMSLASISVTASPPAPEPIVTPVVASGEPVVEPKPAASALVSENLKPQPKPRNKNPVPIPVPRRIVPVVVGVVKKAPEDSNNNHTNQTNTAPSPCPETKFDTAGRRRGFQIGKSLFSIVNDPSTDLSDSERRSSANSFASSGSDKLVEQDLEIENIGMFDQKGKKKKKKYSRHYLGTEILAEIHDLDQSKKYEEIFTKRTSNSIPSVNSGTSLRSMDSIPTFLGNGSIKKWNNFENLDGISINSSMIEPLGESDADSSVCPSPNVQSARVSASSLHSMHVENIEKSSLNNDTSHVVDNQRFLNSESVVSSPSVVNEKITTSTPRKEDSRANNEVRKESSPKLKSEEINELEAEWQYQLPSPPQAFRDSSPTNFTDMTNYDTVTFNGLSADSVVTPPPIFDKEYLKETQSESETISEVDTNDSKVHTSKYLSLENLEKRKTLVLERELASLKVAQHDVNKKNDDNTLRTQKSNLISEVEEVIQNRNKGSNLSRANSQSKEKILAGSDSTLPNFKITTYDQPKSKINIFEDDTVRSNVDKKSESPKRNSVTDANVSFKSKNHESEDSFAKRVSTEDTFLANRTNEDTFPKRTSTEETFLAKRNSLEETFLAKRNSTEETFLAKRNSIAESFSAKRNSIEESFLKRNSLTSSSENLAFAKRLNNDDEIFKKPQELSKYTKFSTLAKKNQPEPVSRSESFSQKNGWAKSSPVKRSKSQVSLEKYVDDSKDASKTEESLQKSNSMWNVTGLQSLEVMRMILPKLGSSPPSSPIEEKVVEPVKTSPKQEEPIPVALPKPEIEPPVKEPPKVYQYRGPPSINLGTWSERPKSQISLKEDKDYKISNISAMKAKFSSQTSLNTKQESVPSVNIRVNGVESKDQVDSGKLNIKINSEAKTIINQSPGNVIIKIGEEQSKPEAKNFYSRFLNQTTAAGYRKPLGNINGEKPRPRSIAFDGSCPDISRVPIVRAVELKKTFKDQKSITQITPDDPKSPDFQAGPRSFDIPDYKQESKSSTLGNKYSSVYVSSENVNKGFYNKPISRVNSFAFTRNTNAPVVKGFRMQSEIVDNNNKSNWNNNHYGTLPAKPSSQNNTPFSQHHLKRTNHINQFSNDSSAPIEKVVLRNTASRNFQNRNSIGSFNTVGLPNGGTIPEPPQLPKITSVTKKPRQIEVDPRDQLLSAIRNFGGKGGLKSVK